MTFQQLITVVGPVVWPLLAFSVVAVVLILERILFWLRVAKRQDRLVKDVLSMYKQNPTAASKRLEQNADLPIARIFLAALELDQPDSEEFRLALESAAQAEIPLLKRFNTVFDTIISLSPLLGLLGTVLGVSQALKGFTSGGNTGLVSSGISEALASTVMGLVVAMFTLLFANTFRGLYLRQIALIQEYGGQMELYYRRYHE
jgi:biopolymer transport protein ExbB